MLLLYRLTYRDILPAITIYIPLCFYFIPSCSIKISSHSVFTFHYASTLSRIASAIQCCMDSFTFHYASTLSHPFCPGMQEKIDLHSTMLLLYPGGRIRRREVRANLHSTMLLLYPHSESALSLSPRIYIPLCFYFIRSG